MDTPSETGTPFPSDTAGPIDDWSAAFHDALRDWPLAAAGEWTRWEPGYLVLTIRQVGDEEIDLIMIDTNGGEVTIDFGYTHSHGPNPFDDDQQPEVVAAYTRTLVEQWVGGDIRTAVLTDASGQWCGTMIIESGPLMEELEAVARWLGASGRKIEVRTPRKREWRTYEIDPAWLVDKANERAPDPA